MFKIFQKHPALMTVLSVKADKNMKLGEGEEILKNREVFLQKNGINARRLISADIVHGNNVVAVDKRAEGKIISKADGLVTNQPNLFLSVTVADCLPIFLFDSETQAVGIVHAGWKSLAQNILDQAIARFIYDFGCHEKDILVGIGPGISKDNFEVGKETLTAFEDVINNFGRIFSSAAGSGKYFLDLKLIAKAQLVNLGIPKENIEIHPACTYNEREKYFSFRRDKPSRVEAMMAIIGITS